MHLKLVLYILAQIEPYLTIGIDLLLQSKFTVNEFSFVHLWSDKLFVCAHVEMCVYVLILVIYNIVRILGLFEL